MDRVQVNGSTFEYSVQGSGEPVLLIHGSLIADAFAPLLAQPAIAGRCRLVSYHRRGFAGSSRHAGPCSIAQQAADAWAILKHVGIERAHIVGHSYGGAIALQLALDAPEVVHSLALLEPALMMVPSAAQFFEALAPVAEAYGAGNKAAAADNFMQGVGGGDYRASLDKALPAGWFEQTVAEADTFFQVEMPALQEWQFTEELAKRITRPALAVLGALSDAVSPTFREGYDLQRQWLPQAEGYVLPGTAHMLQMQNPTDMAAALAGFFARHPVPVTA